jgi:hypothetical protein
MHTANWKLITGTSDVRFQREVLRRFEVLQNAVDELKENQNRMWQNQCQNAASNVQNCTLIPVDSDKKWEELQKSLQDNEQKQRLVTLIIFFQNKRLLF